MSLILQYVNTIINIHHNDNLDIVNPVYCESWGNLLATVTWQKRNIAII